MGVFRNLLMFLFLVPLIEIYLLIKVGSVIGAVPTIMLVIFTAVLGAWLVRLQGLLTLQRAQALLLRGQMPAVEALEGVALLAGGALLIIPGFFTDTLGFLLLIPRIRRRVIRWFLRRQDLKVTHIDPYRGRDRRSPSVIEGEYRRERD